MIAELRIPIFATTRPGIRGSFPKHSVLLNINKQELFVLITRNRNQKFRLDGPFRKAGNTGDGLSSPFLIPSGPAYPVPLKSSLRRPCFLRSFEIWRGVTPAVRAVSAIFPLFSARISLRYDFSA